MGERMQRQKNIHRVFGLRWCACWRRLGSVFVAFAVAACIGGTEAVFHTSSTAAEHDPHQVSACRFVVPVGDGATAPSQAEVRAALRAAARQMQALGSNLLGVSVPSITEGPVLGEDVRRGLLALGVRPEQIEVGILNADMPRKLYLNACDQATRDRLAAAGPADPERRTLYLIDGTTFAVPAKYLLPIEWADPQVELERITALSFRLVWTGTTLEALPGPPRCGSPIDVACERSLIATMTVIPRAVLARRIDPRWTADWVSEERETDHWKAQCSQRGGRYPSPDVSCLLRLKTLPDTTVMHFQIRPEVALPIERWRVVEALADLLTSFVARK